MSSNPPTKRELWMMMFKESNRLKSFSEWEPTYHASPILLARNGFFHCGPGDKVQCVFCHYKLWKWDPGDCVEDEHRRHCQHCPFVRGLCEYLNVPLSSNLDVQGQVSQDLTTSEAENFSCRFKSMERCHGYDQDHRNSIASAGFFYSSHDGRFHCFCCGLIMPGFEPGVDPWMVHALFFPLCAYLKQVKGADFVQQVQAENTPPTPAANQPVSAETGPSDSTGVSSEASDLSSEQYLHLGPTVERGMTSPAVKAVMKLFDIATAQVKERLMEIMITNGIGYIVRSEDFRDLMLNCTDHCVAASEPTQSGQEIALEMASHPRYGPYLKHVIDRDMASATVMAVMEFFHIPTARIRERLLEIRFIYGTGYELRSEDFNDLMLNCAEQLFF